ncbi:ABC transporter ATP-binding protein [Corynebacterium diphtheriae]|uniref:AAA family ATPase n=1 Tax=Corynebacterium diphtheriae TaxID=1717 RepID=UPI00092BB415|nr:ABC transporter ATP-binding protein [Corynebacterium diphtheriae]OJH88623.1 ABC transporter ATP-binding protein [Corynebacterium diphtheriae]
MTTIHVSDLSKTYGTATNAPVLSGVSFDLTSPAIHGLIGANGVGKTTLLRALAGQSRCEGVVEIDGQPTFDNPKVMDRCVLMGIDVPLPSTWRATKLLSFAQHRYPRWDEARCAQLIDAFQVPVDKPYQSLSRGQKSALGIIIAFSATCDITLLDEPYLGLDVANRDLFYRELRAEQARCPRLIILSTHHINEASHVFDSVMVLKKDGVALQGDVESITGRVVELVGPKATIEGFVSHPARRIGEVHTAGGVAKVLAEARAEDWDQLSALGLRTHEVSLERAVMFLERD